MFASRDSCGTCFWPTRCAVCIACEPAKDFSSFFPLPPSPNIIPRPPVYRILEIFFYFLFSSLR